MKGYSALEDVPMVVPIALALVLFFGALSWAVSTVNRSNQQVDLTLAMIRVADAFAQWSVLTDATWSQSCDALRSNEKDVFFAVYLVSPGSVSALLNSLSHNFSFSPPGSLKSCIAPSARPPRRGQTILLRYFPVSYQKSSGGIVENDVMFLVVAVWPKE